MTGEKVLVVDDEPQVREVLRRYLAREGYEVLAASDGEEALRTFEAEAPDLVVLDLMLPRRDGLAVYQRLNAQRDVPVVMLTARGEESDRLLGLGLGADDYIVKPFSPREVVARVRNVLRRRERGGPGPSARPVQVGDLRIDPEQRQVTVGGREVVLTQKEFDLLHFLAQHPGRVFTRAELMTHVWGYAFGDSSTVTVHVRRIREKIEADASAPKRLRTVWGVGYRVVADDE